MSGSLLTIRSFVNVSSTSPNTVLVPSSKITLQFWAQSVKAGDYHIMFRCHDASGERYYISKYTLVANTWKHIEIVVPGDSNLVFNDDNGEGLEVRWMLSAGDDRNDATAGTWFAPGSDYDQTTNTQVNFFDSTDNNFFLTGVQLEVGDVASGFEHLPHDMQLQRCSRYYHPLSYGLLSSAPVMFGLAFGGLDGSNVGSDNVMFPYNFPVPMRDAPTVTVGSAGSGTGSASTQYISEYGCQLYYTSNGASNVWLKNVVAASEL